MAQPSGIGGEDDKIQPETRQNVSNGEERDSEKGMERGNGQYTQIDPAIASRIAANVDDFMVSILLCFL